MWQTSSRFHMLFMPHSAYFRSKVFLTSCSDLMFNLFSLTHTYTHTLEIVVAYLGMTAY